MSNDPLDISSMASSAQTKVDQAADAAHSAIDQARDKLTSTSGQLRDQAQKATDYAVGYAKDEPVKAMLYAAAAGAALMGLLQLMTR